MPLIGFIILAEVVETPVSDGSPVTVEAKEIAGNKNAKANKKYNFENFLFI